MKKESLSSFNAEDLIPHGAQVEVEINGEKVEKYVIGYIGFPYKVCYLLGDSMSTPPYSAMQYDINDPIRESYLLGDPKYDINDPIREFRRVEDDPQEEPQDGEGYEIFPRRDIGLHPRHDFRRRCS